MTITFVFASTKLTGGTRVCLELANGLAKRSHTVHIVSLGSPDDISWMQFHANVHTHFVGRSLTQRLAGYVYRSAFGFQAFPEEETRLLMPAIPKSDVVIATLSYTAYAVVRSGKGVPVHYYLHYEPLVREEGYKKRIMEETYLLPTLKISNSSWLSRMMRKKSGQSPMGEVFPAIDHEVFYPTEREKSNVFTIVSLAKDKWWKGFPDALRAIREVRRRGHDVRFLAFGTSFSKERLPEDVRDIEFEFVGPKKDIELAEFYRSADALISASYFESFPLPPLEAMACGVPVVTTPYGTEDYARDGETALIVEAQQPIAMADALERLIKDHKLRQTLIDAGRHESKRFTWEITTDKFEHLLTKALQHVAV